jgi:hypothetical protein
MTTACVPRQQIVWAAMLAALILPARVLERAVRKARN